MPNQSWRNTGNAIALSQRTLRDALLNRHEVQIALAKYVNSLNLQGQVNRGEITENQALVLFVKAGQDFMRGLHTEINNRINTLQNNSSNQIDLTDPIAVQNQLNLPGSPLNIQMENLAGALMESIDEDTNVQTQMQNQQAQEEKEEENTSVAASSNTQSDTPTNSLIMKGVEIAVALRIMHDLDPKLLHDVDHKLGTEVKKQCDVVEEKFHKVTGIKGGHFEGIKSDAKELHVDERKSPLAQLKPHFEEKK